MALKLAPIHLGEVLAAASGVVGGKAEDTSVRIYRDGQLYQIPLSHLYFKSGQVKVWLLDEDAIFLILVKTLRRPKSTFNSNCF